MMRLDKVRPVLLIRKIVGFDGDIYFNTDKPDGTPRKLMDSSRLHALGWNPEISLEAGIARTYQELDKSDW